MKPANFDDLPRTSDGSPIVTLMTDPDMGEDGAEGFLSLVNRGANGRRIAVVKSDGSTQKLDDAPELETTLDLGQQPGFMQWFSSLFGPLLGLREPQAVSKSDAVTFDEAVVIPLVFDRLWDGISALEQSIGSILRDETVRDKQQAVDIALTGFARFVSSAFSEVPVLKADQAAAVRIAADQVAVNPARRVIKAQDLATITATQEALEQAAQVLRGLATRGDNAPDPKKPKGDDKAHKAHKAAQEDPDMTPEQIAKVAEAAAQAAQKAHKSVDPSADTAAIVAAGEAARLEVMKAAVAGPAQPGIPKTVLKDQVAESSGIQGKAPAPMAKFEQAINRLTSLTSKIDETLHGKGEGDDRVAGLVDVVTKQGEALAAVATKVAKVAGTPQASNSGGDQPKPAELAQKADDTDWSNTALGGF